ncbi:hypothetical protein HU200_041136 [Digitaria exilis]|uniref:Defensin n=1 Tax=Digitaria exilis TaxID=1010633 RepID=A0A835B8D5_9POAL|nr:hypothetical protein HU200_041136 [Digitaria exilis]
MRTSFTLLIVVALVVQYSGTYCRVLPPSPGACNPTSCFTNCHNSIGVGAIGECVAGGCQCTYCTPPKSK